MPTLTVGPAETYTTINDALAAASSSDIIEIKDTGNPYAEEVTDHSLTSITLRGHASNTGKWKLENTGGLADAIKFLSGWVIEDAEIDGYSDDAISTVVGSENLTLRRCYIHDITGKGVIGVDGSSLIERCWFKNIGETSINRGVIGSTVRNCQFDLGCSASGGWDTIGGSTGTVVYNTLINQRGTGAGIVHGSNLYRCDNNIIVAHASTPGARGIEITDENPHSGNYVHGAFTGVAIGTSGNSANNNPTEFVTTAAGDAPIFVDAPNGNFAQTAASPALAKGRYISTVLTDYLGLTRDKIIVYDKAVTFGGTDEFAVNDSGVATAIGSSDFSFGAWVKVDDIDESLDHYMMGFVTAASASVCLMQMTIVGGQNSGYLRVQTAAAATQGSNAHDMKRHGWWTLCMITLNVTTRECKAYVNAKLAWTVTLDATYPGITSTDHFRVGRGAGATVTDYWEGSMHNVTVWNKVLTQAGMTELYNAGVPKNPTAHSASSNLLGWWKLGTNDTHPTLVDVKNGNNLTMTNMEAGDIVTSDHFYGMEAGAVELITVSFAPAIISRQPVCDATDVNPNGLICVQIGQVGTADLDLSNTTITLNGVLAYDGTGLTMGVDEDDGFQPGYDGAGSDASVISVPGYVVAWQFCIDTTLVYNTQYYLQGTFKDLDGNTSSLPRCQFTTADCLSLVSVEIIDNRHFLLRFSNKLIGDPSVNADLYNASTYSVAPVNGGPIVGVNTAVRSIIVEKSKVPKTVLVEVAGTTPGSAYEFTVSPNILDVFKQTAINTGRAIALVRNTKADSIIQNVPNIYSRIHNTKLDEKNREVSPYHLLAAIGIEDEKIGGDY